MGKFSRELIRSAKATADFLRQKYVREKGVKRFNDLQWHHKTMYVSLYKNLDKRCETTQEGFQKIAQFFMVAEFPVECQLYVDAMMNNEFGSEGLLLIQGWCLVETIKTAPVAA